MKTSFFQTIDQLTETVLSRFSTWALGIACIVSLVLAIYFNVVAGQEFFRSGYPVSLFESQLAFSGPVIKEYHQVLLSLDTMDIYLNVQYLDYALMFFTGLFFFIAALLIARAHQANSFWRRVGLVGALITPAATLTDAIENIFLLMMLSAPLSFPDWLAIAYSLSAFVKLVLFVVGLLWLIASGLILSYQKLSTTLAKQRNVQRFSYDEYP
jgi:hypothetical protein